MKSHFAVITLLNSLTLLTVALVSNPTAAIASPEPTATLSGTALPQAQAATSAYILGAGDQIDITVLGYQEFTGSKIILSDGTIALPVIGTVKAAGRSPTVLAEELRQQLRPFLKNPVVTIGVLNSRPLLITIAGEVQRPGPIQLQNFNSMLVNSGNPPRELPTVSSALTLAGGLTRNADIRKITLRRVTPSGASVTTINLWDAVVSDAAASNALLQDGDALFVPKLAADDPIDRRLLARSTLAPRVVRVRVVGEVKRPGEVEVPPSSSLSSAVAIAGGPTDKAKLSDVTFVRLRDDGKVERQKVDLRNLVDAQQVQDGDVVIVPKSTVSSVLDFATQLFAPLGLVRNLIP